ncbi:hypothetical protein AbraIFM66951_007558 [Aspergillus brasiliensis]|uniref:FAD-binding domain-containing protein n=1 Tax=Aspergillus brasiliensis TaxID=319629 RepID=A0A9W5YWY7_9EURO|nr:hypothetical protein AbraCBS73388_009939 [Aspergillus brasiliensis]GKZ41004.1 hypothetical protein AbraIFM66951_007558 [Aspergillus brasiliensis]
MARIETDVLVVGTGPAGASLACFLVQNGVKGLIISQASSTVRTPRAHYTNNATFECLRDLGIEQECRKNATPKELLMYYRIAESMAGEEYSRACNCGTDPKRYGEFKEASPCEQADLPQSILEPILLRVATQGGFRLRWDTKLVDFTRDEESGNIHSVIEDLATGEHITVVSRYLCGADGAHSIVARKLQLPFNDTPGGGLALNVLCEADLTHLLVHSPGLIHVLLRSDKPQPDFCAFGIARFVEPFTKWVFVLLAKPGVNEVKASEAEIVAHVRDLIGDPSVQVKLQRISRWKVNECYAERYSNDDNVFCLGDAVHRHPPFNGLGSNTCIQDAYNLAWKIAYVLQGKAVPSLLASFNRERQPIGQRIVKRANDTGRMHAKLFGMLGVSEPDVTKKKQILDRFSEDSDQGAMLRTTFQQIITDLDQERHGLGCEMNQLYESHAVYTADETGPAPVFTGVDAELHYYESTFPGSRLPHAWLRAPQSFGPGEPMISTHDLAGHGRFTLFTGLGGKSAWQEAAAAVEAALKVPIAVYNIGWRQDYEDVFFAWSQKSGVSEKGAVLLRPDRTVAWRSQGLISPSSDCVGKLGKVMSYVLGREWNSLQ